MKSKLLAVPLAGIGILALTAQKSSDAPKKTGKDGRKNILMFFMDDLGYKDTGFTGSDFYETPTIDSLARNSLVFNISYSGGANSAPSRACLISGTYSPRTEVYAVFNTTRGPKDEMLLRAIPNNDTLPKRIYTIADAMAGAGYNTAIIGKWHLGEKPGYTPDKRGFIFDNSSPTQSNAQFKATNDPKAIFEETSQTLDVINKSVKEGKPFFVYMAFHAVHQQWRAQQKYIDYFKAKTPGKQHNEVVYAAMIKHADDAIKEVVGRLRQLGIDKNTVIVFTSDNGGIPSTSQAPLRGFKGTFYEGGIRVPTFINYPGGVVGSCNVPIINVDYYPTFVEIAGAKLPKEKILDGESLLPIVLGKAKTLNRESIFWHFPGYLDRTCPGARDTVFRQRPATMIRKGDWKLILFHEEWVLKGGRANIDKNHAVELYNEKEDISEKRDLSNVNKAKRDELLDDLLKWMKDTGAKTAVKFNDSNRFTQKEIAASKQKQKDEDE